MQYALGNGGPRQGCVVRFQLVKATFGGNRHRCDSAICRGYVHGVGLKILTAKTAFERDGVGIWFRSILLVRWFLCCFKQR